MFVITLVDTYVVVNFAFKYVETKSKTSTLVLLSTIYEY